MNKLTPLQYTLTLKSDLADVVPLLRLVSSSASPKHQYMVSRVEPEPLEDTDVRFSCVLILKKDFETVAYVIGASNYQLGKGRPARSWLTIVCVPQRNRKVFIPFIEELTQQLSQEGVLTDFGEPGILVDLESLRQHELTRAAFFHGDFGKGGVEDREPDLPALWDLTKHIQNRRVNVLDLREQGLTIAEIARKVAISRRTVDRDVKWLSEHGFLQ